MSNNGLRLFSQGSFRSYFKFQNYSQRSQLGISEVISTFRLKPFPRFELLSRFLAVFEIMNFFVFGGLHNYEQTDGQTEWPMA